MMDLQPMVHLLLMMRWTATLHYDSCTDGGDRSACEVLTGGMVAKESLVVGAVLLKQHSPTEADAIERHFCRIVFLGFLLPELILQMTSLM